MVPGGPYQYYAVHQYSVVRRVWGASAMAMFLIFAPPTAPQNLIARILSTPVRCISERVARLIALQAGARGSSSPDGRKPPVRQSPRLSARLDRSTGSAMRSGSLPKHKLKSLSFADALVRSTPEEKEARERVMQRNDETRNPRREMKRRRRKPSLFANPLTILDEN